MTVDQGAKELVMLADAYASDTAEQCVHQFAPVLAKAMQREYKKDELALLLAMAVYSAGSNLQGKDLERN
jgi:alkylhydroperoxidase/carboxymuconolactone decarboxylase family protein YurZ